MNQLINVEQKVKLKAKGFKESLGGTIFAFPIEEDNPFSDYAVVVYIAGEYFVYPRAAGISEAAVGVLTILESLKETGVVADYEKDVRFISHKEQMDAPSVTMRKLKKNNISKPLMQKDKDVKDGGEETGPLFTARGTLKIIYLSMVDDNKPKAIQFMDEYYKLLAMNRYGKTAAAIKKEVRRMSKEEGTRWIEQTFEKFIKDPMDIFDIFNSIAERTD